MQRVVLALLLFTLPALCGCPPRRCGIGRDITTPDGVDMDCLVYTLSRYADPGSFSFRESRESEPDIYWISLWREGVLLNVEYYQSPERIPDLSTWANVWQAGSNPYQMMHAAEVLKELHETLAVKCGLSELVSSDTLDCVGMACDNAFVRRAIQQ
jgi:hypothetical protein